MTYPPISGALFVPTGPDRSGYLAQQPGPAGAAAAGLNLGSQILGLFQGQQAIRAAVDGAYRTLQDRAVLSAVLAGLLAELGPEVLIGSVGTAGGPGSGQAGGE